MLNELLKSRHYRLKIQCIVLMVYTMFNCHALIWLLLAHLDIASADHINFFTTYGTESSWTIGIGISCLCSLIAVIIWWIFAFRVLIQYYHKQDDISWMKSTKLLAKIGTLFWLFSQISWIITVLFIPNEKLLSKLLQSLIPEWNKTLIIGWIYSIFLEFNQQKSVISRNNRVTKWITILCLFLSIYIFVFTLLCIFSWIMLFYNLLINLNIDNIVYWSFTLIGLSFILTPFYNFFCILYNQLSPSFKWPFYMICIPCCCGCFCTDKWCRFCVPPCCYNRNDIRISVWLIIGMTFIWLVCTILLNFNDCLAHAAIVEYAYGFRGASILIIFYSVLINIELTYSGEIKNRLNQVDLTVNAAGSGNDDKNAADHQRKDPIVR